MMEDDYTEVGRDYECDVCLENKILHRLCGQCFDRILHNHLIAFYNSTYTPEEYINKIIKKTEVSNGKA